MEKFLINNEKFDSIFSDWKCTLHLTLETLFHLMESLFGFIANKLRRGIFRITLGSVY